MKILIIDDEVHVCDYLKLVLESMGKSDVFMAHSGEAAWRLFNQITPTLVLLDIKMNGMKGDELLRKIKGQAVHTKVIVVSSVNDLEQVNQLVLSGADSYIFKNNSPEKIAQIIGKYMD